MRGRIKKALSGFYYVDTGEGIVTCRARGRFRKAVSYTHLDVYKRQYERCPQCGGIMKHIGTGTQKVEEELHALFPGAKVLRMDTDTVGASHGYEKLLRQFEEEKIPILLGTQMVAKGLDFENVTLVGVLCADVSLYIDN